jgi:hypothetical protein
MFKKFAPGVDFIKVGRKCNKLIARHKYVTTN